jgi:hypothetical protein
VRNRALAVIGTALLLALAGCTTPEPATPTPTAAFSSEEEAFAAAEETYRAYVDATNSRRVDPSAQPSPFDFLTGDALESDIDAETLQRQHGLQIVGPTFVVDVRGLDYASPTGSVRISVCIDVAQARVVDESGNDVTPDDRADRAMLDVGLVSAGDALLIEDSELATDSAC